MLSPGGPSFTPFMTEELTVDIQTPSEPDTSSAESERLSSLERRVDDLAGQVGQLPDHTHAELAPLEHEHDGYATHEDVAETVGVAVEQAISTRLPAETVTETEVTEVTVPEPPAEPEKPKEPEYRRVRQHGRWRNIPV